MKTGILIGFASLLVPSVAVAQSAPPPAPPPAAPTAPTPPPPSEPDGVRFRGGISLGGGGFFGSQGAQDFSAILGGVDGRLGIQINHWIGIYAQPHLSFGSVSIGGAKGLTGEFSATVMADVTIIHRIFVGAGGGVGILNNPAGGELQFRLGAYPLMGFGEGARRKGLMVGADLRLVFLPAPYSVAVMPFFSIGYEAF